MCWALPSAGDSVDYEWVLNYLLCTVFPLPQQKTWASNAFPGKAVQTQWPLKVSFCALPEPVAEVWHLASLQASTRISTESVGCGQSQKCCSSYWFWVCCWWRGFISWRPTQQYYKEVKAHPAVTTWPEWPWQEESFPSCMRSYLFIHAHTSLSQGP